MIANVQRELAPQFEHLACAGALSEEDRLALATTVEAFRSVIPRAIIVRAGVPLVETVLLVDGFVSRQREMDDGRRQILGLHVPGDFVDLHGLLLGRLDHDVVALSAARIGCASHARMRELVADLPDLGRKLWFVTAVDAATHRQWIANLSRPAVERIAHLFCELHARLKVVGRVRDDCYVLPLTQADLADSTALTPVHVNRTLRHLRERGLVNFRGGRVEIEDLAELIRVAQFDPAYLYLDRGTV